jgi:hypothetical protein
VPALLAAAIAPTASLIAPKARATPGHLEQDERGQECEQEANGNRSPRHGTAVFADDPGEGDKRKDAQQRLKMLHCLAVSVGRGWSGAPLLRRRHGLRGQAPSRHV